MHRLLISFLGIDKGFGNDIKLWNHKCAPNWHFCRKKYQKSLFKKILPIQGGENQQSAGRPGEKYLVHRDIRGHFYIGRPIVASSNGKITL
jgi:hypothetical protein